MEENNRVTVVSSELDMYEGGEEKEDAVVEGVTDSISQYAFTDIQYPCIMFNKGFHTEKHKFQVLQNMLSNSQVESDITVYFTNSKGEILKVGKVSGYQLSFLLDIVGRENVTGYYADGSVLDGGLIYTLCTF